MDKNWKYFLGHEDGGKMRKCKMCEKVRVEYWYDNKSGDSICSKCCNGNRPDTYSLMVQRKKIECEHCGEKTQA